MTFNQNTFLNALKNSGGVSNFSGWNQWKGTTGALNQTSEYTIGDYTYRTWYQETSVMRTDMGILVSCKIDFERTTGDDHIIILAGFAKRPTGSGTNYTIEMVFAQASVQFHGDSDDNVIGAPVMNESGTVDMGQAIYDSLSSITSIDFGTVDDSTAGRQTLPGIAQRNINAMLGCVSA